MIPKIVIVGRPNVGKSSLLNMLAGRRISIVDPTAGVTRDRISANIELAPDEAGPPRVVELIDTGGYGVEDVQNLTADIERQIARGLDLADVVLFVVDAQQGVTPLDQTVAQYLRQAGRDSQRRSETPILLVINKVDSLTQEPAAYEAMKLGFGDPVLVSAVTKHNLHELTNRLYRALPTHEQLLERYSSEQTDASGGGGVDASRALDEGLRLAIVGKRNAGKSTLVNAIAGEERVIVSDQEGTTRDSVDVHVEHRGEIFTIIDTAGMRKRKSVKQDIEYYSMHRALRSVRRADVCLLVIDATLPISQVDKQLSGEILKHFVPAIIVVNKWDLVEGQATQEDYMEYLDKELIGLSFAPIVFTSAKDREGIVEVLAMAHNLYEQASHRVSTSEMNEVFERIAEERGPSSKGGKRARIYYATQIEVRPPTIMLSVNAPELFEANNYQRFLLNRLRDELPYSEVPIKLVVRGKQRDKE